MANTAVDLTGYSIDYLTVVRSTGRSTRYGRVWVVRCKCGVEKEMGAATITKKKRRPHSRIPRSCGCWRKNNRSHLYKGVGDLSSTRWINIKKHADRKCLEFSITMKYAWDLFVKQDKRCALSGHLLTMDPTSMEAGASTTSLDRIDSRRGYVKGNVQWVHLVVNDLKSNMRQDDFITWCRDIAAHIDG